MGCPMLKLLITMPGFSFLPIKDHKAAYYDRLKTLKVCYFLLEVKLIGGVTRFFLDKLMWYSFLNCCNFKIFSNLYLIMYKIARFILLWFIVIVEENIIIFF